jgi:hypothetical protein
MAPLVKVTYTPKLEQRDMDTSSAADLGRRRFIGDNRGNNFSIYWPPSNYSAAIGLNGFFAFPPVGGRQAQANWGWGGVPNKGRAGYVATAYDLLCESLVADTSDCAGEGTNDPHPHNTPCLDNWRKHPEWFVCKPVTCDLAVCPFIYPCSMAEVNRTYNSQPCWSIPSVQTKMADSVLKILRQNPNATSISVTGMDGAPAECPPDGKANREENTTGGANFRAVQAIADIVSKEFPRVKIQTLAYDASFQPPTKLRFKSNVIVQLCIGGMNQFLPLSHPENKAIADTVRAWTKVVPTLYIWDYTYSEQNTLLPFGNYYTQARHIQELVAIGVKGYYGEGMPHPGIDMIDLKTWVAARTAFDPSLNTEDLITEFTDTFYSPAAGSGVREYMGIVATGFNSSNKTLDYMGKPLKGDPSRHLGLTNAIFGNTTLLTAAAALTSAKKAATPGDIYQKRLSQALMGVQWVMLQRWDELHEFAAANKIAWPLSHSKETEFAAFGAALTFACENDEPNMAAHPSFDEHIPITKGSSRYTSISCDLLCFRKQLGLAGTLSQPLFDGVALPQKSTETTANRPPLKTDDVVGAPLKKKQAYYKLGGQASGAAPAGWAGGTVTATCTNSSGDCTLELQAALDSGASTVLVPHLGGRPWILSMAGNPNSSSSFSSTSSGSPAQLQRVQSGGYHGAAISLRSNQEIVLASGVVLQAARGSFHGEQDSLVNGVGVRNVTIRGEPPLGAMIALDIKVILTSP